MARRFVFEGIENFRDLGGYACDYGTTQFGNVYRSATLAYATPADIEKMAQLGIKTIVDLRGFDDQARLPLPHKHDPRFSIVELEVNGKGRISKDREDYIASYLEMLEDPESARKIFLALINAEKPLVFHCNAGKDRTGVFSMVLLMLAGVDDDDINADYMLSFPYLRKMTVNTRAYHPEVPELLLTPDPLYVLDFLKAFRARYGTAEKYCEVIGLGEDETEYLKNVLGKHEKSCGAVVFKDGKVLVEHMAKGHYSIPKGHVEAEDEDEYATARREIREETGLRVRFIDGYRKEIAYSPRSGVVKKVVFFLAEVAGGSLTPQIEEVSGIYFITPADCMITLTHDSDRKVVAEASHYYASH